jgi:hypothetical protein
MILYVLYIWLRLRRSGIYIYIYIYIYIEHILCINFYLKRHLGYYIYMQAQTQWDFEAGRSEFSGAFASPPNWDRVRDTLDAVEQARIRAAGSGDRGEEGRGEAPKKLRKVKKKKVGGSVRGEDDGGRGSGAGSEGAGVTGAGEAEGESGEDEGSVVEAVRKCEEAVGRLRRQAVWELIVAGATDLALKHLTYLRGGKRGREVGGGGGRVWGGVPEMGDVKERGHVTDSGQVTVPETGPGHEEGLRMWEEAVAEMVERSCLVLAVRHRLPLTPDWVNDPTKQDGDRTRLPAAVLSVCVGLQRRSGGWARGGWERECLRWVVRLAEGECMVIYIYICIYIIWSYIYI